MSESIDATFFDADYRHMWQVVLTRERLEWEMQGLGAMLEDFPPPQHILDLCGGDGRIGRPTALADFDVTVLDASRSMLEHGRTQPGADQVAWLQADARAIPLIDESVDGVFNLFSSFGFFATDGEHQIQLAEVARVLKPGGWFIMDCLHRDWVSHAQPRRTWHELPDGERVLRSLEFDPVSGRTHESAALAGRPDTERTWSQRVFSATELDRMLRAVGLEPIHWYDGFDLNPFSADAPRMLVMAQRPRGAQQNNETSMNIRHWRDIIDRLACPETGRPLFLLDDAGLATLNAAIEEGRVETVKGEPTSDAVEAALVREDGLRAYAVRDDIPALFPDEALDVDGLSLR